MSDDDRTISRRSYEEDRGTSRRSYDEDRASSRRSYDEDRGRGGYYEDKGRRSYGGGRNNRYGDEEAKRYSRAIFIGGIPYDWDEKDLEDTFGRYGRLDRVTVTFDRATGKNRGFAFVTFANRRDAEDAYDKYNGHVVDGRRLRLDWDAGLENKRGSNYGRQRSPSPRPARRRYSRSRSRSHSRSPRRSRSRERRERSRSREASPRRSHTRSPTPPKDVAKETSETAPKDRSPSRSPAPMETKNESE